MQQPQQNPMIEAVYVEYDKTIVDSETQEETIKNVTRAWATDMFKYSMNETTGVIVVKAKQGNKQVFGTTAGNNPTMWLEIVRNPNYVPPQQPVPQPVVTPVPLTAEVAPAIDSANDATAQTGEASGEQPAQAEVAATEMQEQQAV